MVELVVTRGLPGCGKSTWAKQWVMEDLRHRARVERDQLRNMMHFGEWRGRHTENQVVCVQRQAVTGLLLSGISVVISDTCLDSDTFEMWRDLAVTCKSGFRVQDFRNLPLETVLEQNAQRTGKEFIPKDVILSMHRRYIA